MAKKISPNSPCPCGSGKKYKKCCQTYHKGAKAKDALSLMKSRYSAYVAGDAKYIIKTTHRENPDFTEDIKKWRDEILEFSKNNTFLSLEIIDYKEKEIESIVEFKAILNSGIIEEKSLFKKENGEWLYHSAI